MQKLPYSINRFASHNIWGNKKLDPRLFYSVPQKECSKTPRFKSCYTGDLILMPCTLLPRSGCPARFSHLLRTAPALPDAPHALVLAAPQPGPLPETCPGTFSHSEVAWAARFGAQILSAIWWLLWKQDLAALLTAAPPGGQSGLLRASYQSPISHGLVPATVPMPAFKVRCFIKLLSTLRASALKQNLFMVPFVWTQASSLWRYRKAFCL